ncbi:Lacal_2735 family protein [Seonamhaeicola sp. ML3]|uniref:Lacal_2735 family protein n=1 Tax=Seonamhaeicola sp. ML3 TaxID=2937786 RepID=UPI00200C711E|nr:Lacal_2735 family protein [Seonamhaeicola sp. ML3]
MFKIFKRNSKREKLEKKVKRLLKEWHELSSINRKESDKKYAEAQEILAYLNKTNHEIS